MSTPPFPNMDELLQRLLDDQLEPDEMQRLAQAIRADPRVRDYYIDSMLVSAVVRRSSQATGELSKSDLIAALSGGKRQSGSRRLGRRFYATAALLMLGALVLVSLHWLRPRAQGPALGTLADAYEAQWRGSHPRPGELLYAGSYDLREGVAKMALGEGASLLLEAPCRVELQHAGEVTLRSGRLAVEVLPPAQGFRVRTSTALITDLGTEFGVIASPDGSTEAHVLKGHVNIALDPNRTRQPRSVIVNEGSAAVVDARGLTIRDGLAARADLFLLQLPPVDQPSNPMGRLNLADIVGGGDGHGSGASDRGIDVGTGQGFDGPATVIVQTRRSEFRPSPQSRGVDGVFMPNGASSPVVISSTGLLFAQCPRTTGSYYGGPANSGRYFDIPSRQIHTALLHGIRYGTSSHPALTLHPNAGITFDLDQIRQDNPDLRMERFTAVCGIPGDLPQPRFSSADAWVLLDGVVRLHLHYPTKGAAVEKVDVPIPPQTRFLTLVTTCSRRADYSWILFGDPFLEPAAPLPAEPTR